MSQIISKGTSSNEIELSKRNSWKKPMLMAFHSAAASTYGFAICWQNVSAASVQIYQRTNPLMRPYGRWRFLTYNCLVMQFVAYSLCLTSHFIPKLRRPKDFFFTTFAFPVGLLVVTSFWSIWFSMGREYIFPATLEPFYPPWLNHITHTFIAPINLIELISTRHNYSSDRKALIPLVSYLISYSAFGLYIKVQTGRFVYPFLNKMDYPSVGAFIVGSIVFSVIFYKSGKFLHDVVHGLRSVKDRYTGKGSPSSKRAAGGATIELTKNQSIKDV